MRRVRSHHTTEPNEMTQTNSVILEVQGLCCHGEKSLLEKKVGALAGVTELDVNVVAQRLRVTYDPEQLTPQDIIKSVAETGMKALAADHATTTRFAWWKDPRIVLLGVSALFAVAGLVGEHMGASIWVARGLYLTAVAAGGYYPARSGLSAARTRSMNINTLLILGVVGTVGLDLWSEAAILVCVYSLGNVLETVVVKKARGAIGAFMGLMPEEATVIRGGESSRVATARIEVGETVFVRPGERIPLDGIVTGGDSFVDEAAVTGEAIPVSKHTGGMLFAGTMNQKGSLRFRVTKRSQETTLAKIINSVETAQAEKSKSQLFGERFSAIYTPIMFGLGIAVAIVPPLAFGAPWGEWIYRALVVFVVSCSCGLALSVPVAIVAGISHAARQGILTRGGLYLERLARVKVAAFDKTGTLTIGRPRVNRVVTFGDHTADRVLALAAAIELHSEHPLGEAIVRQAREALGLVAGAGRGRAAGSDAGATVSNAGTQPDMAGSRAGIDSLGGSAQFEWPEISDFESVTGRGVRARADGRDYFIGSEAFLRQNGIDLEVDPTARGELRGMQEDAHTIVWIADGGGPIGLFGIGDSIKPESRETIATLKALGLDVVMLTGDTRGTAKAIAARLQIDDVRAELMPHDKIDTVTRLREQRGEVMMVGDGINDAAAMAASDVGVAMGAAGTDVAMESGDIVLLADDLSRLPLMVRLSRRTMRNVYQNIFFSLLVIALLVPAALWGRIDLLPGLIINEGGALLVIMNGLRLLR